MDFNKRAFLHHPAPKDAVRALNFKGFKVYDIRFAPKVLADGDIKIVEKDAEKEYKKLIEEAKAARA